MNGRAGQLYVVNISDYVREAKEQGGDEEALAKMIRPVTQSPPVDVSMEPRPLPRSTLQC